jgi:hypothetical protein
VTKFMSYSCISCLVNCRKLRKLRIRIPKTPKLKMPQWITTRDNLTGEEDRYQQIRVVGYFPPRLLALCNILSYNLRDFIINDGE